MARVGTGSGNRSNQRRSAADPSASPRQEKQPKNNQVKDFQDAANYHREEGREECTESNREEQLSQSRASRARAENTRQKIADKILESTKEVCQKLIADGEASLQRARKLEIETEGKQQQAQEELKIGQSNRKEARAYAERVKAAAQRQAQEKLDQAQNIMAEAEAYRDRVTSEAQHEAREQLDRAHFIRTEAVANREKVMAAASCQSQQILFLASSAAEQECTEMKNHADHEVQRMMAETELVKATAQEELEIEKIYAETALLEVEFLEALSQAGANLADPAAFSRYHRERKTHGPIEAEGKSLEPGGGWFPPDLNVPKLDA